MDNGVGRPITEIARSFRTLTLKLIVRVKTCQLHQTLQPGGQNQRLSIVQKLQIVIKVGEAGGTHQKGSGNLLLRRVLQQIEFLQKYQAEILRSLSFGNTDTQAVASQNRPGKRTQIQTDDKYFQPVANMAFGGQHNQSKLPIAKTRLRLTWVLNREWPAIPSAGPFSP